MRQDFPRFRRLRQEEGLRRLVQEVRLSPSQLVLPLFVAEGVTKKEPIPSLPGHFHWSPEAVVEVAEEAYSLGIPAVLLFGLPAEKDEVGSGAYSHGGVVQRALRELRKKVPGLLLMADVCLCQYTTHGHCGLVEGGKVVNDPTLPLLGQTALSLAEAGAHVVAPSDMMDGRVGIIREVLEQKGFADVVILSYAAKYASAFYGPFREAAHSAPAFGDRRTYQMDPGNRREALREIEEDLREGADMILMKPAGPYLDVIHEARARFDIPLGAYQVSGEYAMIRAAAERGWLDGEKAMEESLLGIARAGADFIVTYFALEAARKLR
ncbi:MAG: porphobilinogen synthase [Bacillota bacterium]|nr:porphobilinogen synthase [Bacillota bacterium]